jgi:hypothetical protein
LGSIFENIGNIAVVIGHERIAMKIVKFQVAPKFPISTLLAK